MKEKKYQEEQSRYSLIHEIYRLRVLDQMSVKEIMSKLSVSHRFVYRALTIFESENPEEAKFMKQQGKELSSEERNELLQEIAKLKKALSEERLRGDFYQEMVDYGKEVYGIDLKKAGTK